MSSIAIFNNQTPRRKENNSRNVNVIKTGSNLEVIRYKNTRTYAKSLDRPKLERVFGGIIILLLLLLGFELIFHFVISPRLTLQLVEIKAPAAFALTDGEILEIAGISGGELYYRVDTDVIARRLANLPMIKEAEVSKTFPGTLHIELFKREPLALFLIDTDRGVVPAVVDEEGIVFEAGAPVMRIQGDLDLPIFSGIEFPALTAGSRMPEQLVPFLQEMEQLRKEAPILYSLISEVKFVKKGRTGFEVLLFFANHQLRVRIGSTIDQRLVKYIMMVLDVVSSQNLQQELEEIDFRTAEVVYRIREE